MTILFWIIASTMTVLVLGLLLWPLLSRKAVIAKGEEEKTLSIYRQQFAELGQDRANGVLTDELYQQARRELERRLLEETGTTEPTPKIARQQLHARPVAIAIAIIVPTVSGLLYWQIGNPLAMTEPSAASLSAQGGAEDGSPFSDGLGPLIERLKQKMEQNPNDGTGWALLARSYMGMGRHAEAALAYENATKLIPDDAQLLADYADAMGVLHGRKLEGRPEALIQQALKIDPRNVKALMLAGTVAFNRKDFGRAAKDWELARVNLPVDVDPEMMQQLVAAIEEAKSHLGGGREMVRMDTEPAAPAQPAKQSGQPRAIRGTITMAPSLAGKGAPTDTLFVFARQMNGPPMPVAIVRATKKDLPFTFQLDDSTSPMPSRKLSSAGPVVIVARLSKSGQAMPQGGDLEGTSQPIESGGEGITIVIDHERMDKESAAPAPQASQMAQPRAIRGTVTMSPSLAGKASATDTLFVFAREMSGPPMPVAIVRATKKDLPFTFQLDDSTSPMPSRKLSSAGPVVIVARLSKSGQAMPQSGDLEGTSQPIQSGMDGINIVIDRERP
ncbi:MAG: c-type cytochrome biogenesis protein CcmI [Nitrospiraceae bacterium]|nr:c-type cytochrome biogenesis protein CcmI [Nitrospiraceae bacterium]